MVLLPAHQSRFTFAKKGEKRVGDATVWVVAYRETRGPMFFRAADGRYVPMTGELWIEPGSGAVRRANYVVDSADAVGSTLDERKLPGLAATVDFSRMDVKVKYQRDPALGAFVPAEMWEILSRERQTGGFGVPALGDTGATHLVRERISSVATYSNVHRIAGSAGGHRPL
jgi:hypothetical protein